MKHGAEGNDDRYVTLERFAVRRHRYIKMAGREAMHMLCIGPEGARL